jgi:inorganic pyrophosphatase
VGAFEELEPFAEDGEINVVIETPQGSRNKLAWDEKVGLFKLKGVLPAGHSFPYDFGFLPKTKGEDGDPIDVLILMDAPVFPGCLVPSRLIGVIEAEQTERDGKTERNDRLIAVAANSRTHDGVKTVHDLSPKLLDEIEHFFISYNEVKGKRFVPKSRKGPAVAQKLAERGRRAYG